MEIIVKGDSKEIADLALELQNRQKMKSYHTELLEKQLKLLSDCSEYVGADVAKLSLAMAKIAQLLQS